MTNDFRSLPQNQNEYIQYLIANPQRLERTFKHWAESRRTFFVKWILKNLHWLSHYIESATLSYDSAFTVRIKFAHFDTNIFWVIYPQLMLWVNFKEHVALFNELAASGLFSDSSAAVAAMNKYL